VAWFDARETLLAEMLASDTFEIEKAKAIIGVPLQRQKRTAQKVDLTIQEFGDEWLERKKTAVSAAKVQEYRETLALVCSLQVGPQVQKKPWKPVTFGAIPLRELRAHHVDWLTNTLSRREGLKGSTMSNTRLNDILLKVVRPLLDLAYERDYLDKNPHDWIQKRREEHPDDIDPFSFEEMLALLAALPAPRWVWFYTVAFGTGLRPSEQYALQWAQVDFRRKVLHIRQGIVKGQVTLLKTAGSRRDVEMLPHVEEAFRRHCEATQGQGLYVFSNRDGGPLHRDNMRNRIWNPALVRAGLRHRNPYQTRHTFASLMLDQNEDPAWVARMLGHTTLRMLYERYGKFIHNRMRHDGERFTRALREAMVRQGRDNHP
jgi:integrase